MTRWLLVRDILLFLLGAAGLAHEVIVTDGERPWLLMLLGGLLGLPAFLRLDGRNGSGTPAPPASPPGPAPPPLPSTPIPERQEPAA